MEEGFARRTWTAGSFGWTAIMVPIDCDYLSMQNDGPDPVLTRTDVENAFSEGTLNAADQFLISVPFNFTGGARNTRFKQGDVFGYIKTASGTAVVTCRWVR